jgi:glycosyltransferase involved in cell wall biosynthesis
VEPIRLARMGDDPPGQVMKLVFINDQVCNYASGDPSAVGGAERQQWLLARALVAAGWSVRGGVRQALPMGQRRSIDGVEFVGVGGGHILLTWYRFLSAERPDWLYWRCADHLLGPVARIARLAHVRTIFAAGFDSDVQPRHALHRRRRWWPLYAWGLSQAERLFLQHGGQLSALPHKWQSKAYVVRSVAGGRASVKPHAERERYVAWVGMLRQPKRPDLLLEIAGHAPAIRFIVCGGPSAHRSSPRYGSQILEALAALPNVEFLGQVEPDRAQRVIADAAVLLSTSDGEGFPNTFLQAWSSGTPVVSLKIDPDSVIEQARLGVVADGVDAAINALRGLLDSPEQRDEIGVRARQYIATHHSEAVVMNSFTSALSS